jgi:hypothetical protein
MRAIDIQEDVQAIEDVVRAYFDSFATKNTNMMERLVHPDLAKRQFVNSADGQGHIEQMSALRLIQLSRLYGAGEVSATARRDVRVLEIYGNIATAIGITEDYHDFLHLAKLNGTWQLVNVLWAMQEK